MSDLSIIKCTVGIWRENSYILSNSIETILIDPGDEFDKIDSALIENRLPALNSVVATHGHFDHVGAIELFKRKYNIPFGIHSKDKRILHQANLYRKIAGDDNFCVIPGIDFNLEDQDHLTLGNAKIVIYQTPGHSDGSVCFGIGTNLFSGDVLLENELGRTDLPGGNRLKIIESIEYILENFIGFTLYPGHGMPFLLDEEKIAFFKKLL